MCAQHYAVKTIENLASRQGEWTDALASGEVAERLAAIWAAVRTEALRSCAASALCRLARQSPGRLLPLLASQRSILHLVRT
jgi:serine/threonine-protein kinase ULK4